MKMKLINLKITNIKNFLQKNYINIIISICLIIVSIILIMYIVKNVRLKDQLHKQEETILKLQESLLEANDYQKIKDKYVQKTDTHRIISKYTIDSLLSRYHY